MSLNGKLFTQILDIIKKVSEGDLNHEISLGKGESKETEELVNFLNINIRHLRELGSYITQIKNEIPQLIDGMEDVLQTIEKASLRVLDNTDGILEQQNTIEQTNDTLKHNPVLNRVFGQRLDKISHSQDKARMFVFDIIQAQEFQELTRKQTEQLVGELENVKNHLLGLQDLFNLQDQKEKPKNEIFEEKEEEKPVRANQDLVDQLLAEFGM